MKRVLVSVTDTTDLLKLAHRLTIAGWEITVTSESLDDLLRSENIKPFLIARYSGRREFIHGPALALNTHVVEGIAADRTAPSFMEAVSRETLIPFDMVIVNFKEDFDDYHQTKDIIGIDMASHALIGIAAANYKHVWTVVDPKDYDRVYDALLGRNTAHADHLRLELARKALQKACLYYNNVIGLMKMSLRQMDLTTVS